MTRQLMKAIRLKEFGAPEILRIEQAPVPTPGPREVLVKITASGVCGRDVLYRQGTLGAASGLILGHEIAGTAVAVGSNVTTVKIGDRVAATQRRSCHACNFCLRGDEVLCQEGVLYGDQLDGGYAEYCTIDEFSLAQVPDGVSDDVAAIAACGVGTGYHALRLANVRGGHRVLVTGASGGVGSHSIQLANAFGAEVIAVTSSPAQVDELSEMAEHVVIATDGKFHREVVDRGLRPDIVLDLTAKYTLESSLRAVKRGGTVVIVGTMAPGAVEVLPGAFIMRETHMMGSKACSRQELEEVLRLVERGRIVPTVGAKYPLEQAAEVHRALESKRIAGRAVLKP